MKETSYLGFKIEAINGKKQEGVYYLVPVECIPNRIDSIDFNIVTYKNGKKIVVFPLDLESVCIVANVKSFYSFKKTPEKLKEAIQKLSGINDEIVLSKTAKRKLYRIMNGLTEKYKVSL